MSDYISRQAAIDEFKDGTEGYDFANWCRADIIEILEQLPSVTPAPKVGRWITPTTDQLMIHGGDVGSDEVICSVCGGTDANIGSSYCYHCGAKMEVEDDLSLQ